MVHFWLPLGGGARVITTKMRDAASRTDLLLSSLCKISAKSVRQFREDVFRQTDTQRSEN